MDKINAEVKKLIEIHGQKYLSTVAGNTISPEEKVGIFLGWCEGASWMHDTISHATDDVLIKFTEAQCLVKELLDLVNKKNKLLKYHSINMLPPESFLTEMSKLEEKFKLKEVSITQPENP